MFIWIAAVREAKTTAIMNCYNEIDGIPYAEVVQVYVNDVVSSVSTPVKTEAFLEDKP